MCFFVENDIGAEERKANEEEGVCCECDPEVERLSLLEALSARDLEVVGAKAPDVEDVRATVEGEACDIIR